MPKNSTQDGSDFSLSSLLHRPRMLCDALMSMYVKVENHIAWLFVTILYPAVMIRINLVLLCFALYDHRVMYTHVEVSIGVKMSGL